MELNQLSDNYGARKKSKRVGRGMASGTGKTSGRGMKGQKARTGVAIKGFEGGQMPLHMRLPKRGFVSRNKIVYGVVNFDDLQNAIDAKKIDASKPITKKLLSDTGLLRNGRGLFKLLSKGTLTAKVTVEADKASKSAIEAVEKLGGSVKLPVVDAA